MHEPLKTMCNNLKFNQFSKETYCKTIKLKEIIHLLAFQYKTLNNYMDKILYGDYCLWFGSLEGDLIVGDKNRSPCWPSNS